MKILLVEDNELNRDMLSRRLERKDFSVICAIDGQEGVNMAQSEKPDLTDGQMKTQSAVVTCEDLELSYPKTHHSESDGFPDKCKIPPYQ